MSYTFLEGCYSKSTKLDQLWSIGSMVVKYCTKSSSEYTNFCECREVCKKCVLEKKQDKELKPLHVQSSHNVSCPMIFVERQLDLFFFCDLILQGYHITSNLSTAGTSLSYLFFFCLLLFSFFFVNLCLINAILCLSVILFTHFSFKIFSIDFVVMPA